MCSYMIPNNSAFMLRTTCSEMSAEPSFPVIVNVMKHFIVANLDSITTQTKIRLPYNHVQLRRLITYIYSVTLLMTWEFDTIENILPEDKKCTE